MQELDFDLSTLEILEAEKERASGKLWSAIKIISPVIDFDVKNFPNLFEDAQRRFLMASRIYVVATHGLANSSWRARDVARRLTITKGVIENTYHNSAVSEAASRLNTDTLGNPYEFHTEMDQDEITYMQAVMALTGNVNLLSIITARMNQVIGQAKEPTARTLAQFEKAHLLQRTIPSKESFQDLKSVFKEAVRASTISNRWERVATISARYAIGALRSGHLGEVIQGVNLCRKSALKDHSTRTILAREFIKDITASSRHWMWHQTTPKGEDYSYLQLK